MALTRGLVAFLGLVPGTLLAFPAQASAADPAAVLPPGIHLDGHGRYHRDIGDHAQPRHPFSSILLPEGWSPDGLAPQAGGTCPSPSFTATGGPFGMAPADALAAYKIPANAKANGAIVAILDSPDSNALKDLQAYRTQYNLPQMDQCASGHGGVGQTPCFSQVAEDGSPSTGGDSGESDGETSLDMDMISAMCFDCSILLVELTQLSDQDFVTGTATATTLGATATSISIGGPEHSDPKGNNYASTTNLVFAASGDFGYNLVNQGGKGGSYPATAADIIAVGGTNLVLTSGAVGTGSYDEAVWNDGQAGQQQDVTTSGCSKEFSAAWQATPTASACGTFKATADISAAATYTAGGCENAIATYCTANVGIAISKTQKNENPWLPVEGTSASSPMMAAIFTRLGLAGLVSGGSSGIGLLYSTQWIAAFNDLGSAAYPSDPSGVSNDLTSSATTCKPTSMCTVGTGWDGPSGIGTPNGTALWALNGGMPTGSSSGGSSSGGSSGGSSSGSSSGGSDEAGAPSGSSSGGTETGSSSGGVPSGSSSGGGGSDDSGLSSVSGDGGLVSTSEDGGSFPASGSSSAGCSCMAPGDASTPLGDTGAMALVVGAIAALGSRSKKRQKQK